MSAPSSKTGQPIGSRHGVVDDQRQPGGMRRVRPGPDVDDVQARVADRLGEHEPRLVVDVPLEILGSIRIDEAHLDAVLGQRVREQVVGAAVERRDGDDVLAGTRDVQHRVGDRRLTGREHECRERRLDEARALELREPLLEHAPGRVHDARVDVAELLEREQVGGMLGVVEHERRRLVDRHRACVGGRVGRLPAVQGDRLGSMSVGAHALLLGNPAPGTRLVLPDSRSEEPTPPCPHLAARDGRTAGCALTDSRLLRRHQARSLDRSLVCAPPTIAGAKPSRALMQSIIRKDGSERVANVFFG